MTDFSVTSFCTTLYNDSCDDFSYCDRSSTVANAFIIADALFFGVKHKLILVH